MLAKIALVGRPNVGKSLLFNRICKKRISIVEEEEGVTRDRIYSEVEIFGTPCLLIDTGGIDFSKKIAFAELVKRQAELAIEEADVVILVVDGKVGVTAFDEEIARILRRSKKPLLLAVNKMDRGVKGDLNSFALLGIADMWAVSAMQGVQVAELLEAALKKFSFPSEREEKGKAIGVAIVGRANVGKSTLLNHLTGSMRSIVSEVQGTTRDAIDFPLEYENEPYLLIDTAGIRRKKAEKETVDKFAAIRTEEAIQRSDVCLLVIDSKEGLTVQERRIAKEIAEQGKSCILLFNKWDLIQGFRMEHALKSVRDALPFLSYAPALFISAQEGRNVEKIFPLIQEVMRARCERIPTSILNQIVERAIQKYHPPLITGKRLRIYYLSQVETSPPKFVLFVNRENLMPESYRKYLLRKLREVSPFSGTPILFELREKSRESSRGGTH